MANRKRVTLAVDKELFRQLKTVAAASDTTVSDVLEDALAAHFTKSHVKSQLQRLVTSIGACAPQESV